MRIYSKKQLLPFFMLLHFLLFAASAVAQSSGEQIEKKLEAIVKVMYQNPVAAKPELLKLLQRKDGVPDSTIAKVYMNLSTVLGMTNRLDSSIYACNEAIRLIPDQSINKSSALKTLAIVYRLKGEWKKAEEAIHLLLQLNDSIWKNDFLKAITLQEYASLCLDQYEYKKATKLFLEALNVVNSPGYKGPEAYYASVKLQVNLAEAYMRSGNYAFSISEFNSAMSKLDSLKDFDGQIRAGINLVGAYISSGQNQKADSLVKALIPNSIQLDNKELQAYIQLKQGDVLAARGEYDKSEYHYRTAFEQLEINDSPALLECATAYLKALKETGNTIEAKRVLGSKVLSRFLANSPKVDQLAFTKAALHFKWQDLPKAELYAYIQNLIQLNDSVVADKEKHSAMQLQAEYQFERQQVKENLLLRENEVLKQKEQFKRKQLYFSTSIAILMLTVLVLLILRLRQRTRNNEKLMKIQEQEILFQKERRDWAEREKDLRDQLIQQQKTELIRSVEDAAELRTKLEQLVVEQQEENRKDILQQFEKGKEEKRSMESLLSQFNAVYPTFAASLVKRYSELTQADVQFCTLYRMNLTTKEISVLLNIEPRSVYIKKYRVVEKMGLSETEQFEQVLFGME
jgi:tetratricopeptide (TPR) repeat protein